MYNHKKYMKEYNAKNKERRRIYREDNKEKISLYTKKYNSKNKDRIKSRFKGYKDRNLKSWEGYIPKRTKCQMCGVSIYLNSGDSATAINFDHRYGGTEVIKGYPTRWLISHKRNPKNEKIWKSCDFGILCRECNRRIPTIGRDKFLRNLNRYLQKGKRCH